MASAVEQQARLERDRVLRTGVRAQSALHAVALDKAQRRRVRRIEQRGFGAGADAGLAQRAGLVVDDQPPVGRAGGQRDLRPRLRRVLRQVVEGEIERGALLAREVEGRRRRDAARRRERPERALERAGILGAQQREMSAAVAQPSENRLRNADLRLERRAVALVRRRRRDDHRLARAVADRAEQQVDADRGRVERVDRNGARRQALAAADRAPADAVHQRAAGLEVVKHEAGILAARRAIGVEQRSSCAARWCATPGYDDGVIAPEGHTVAQPPQPAHRCGSTLT